MSTHYQPLIAYRGLNLPLPEVLAIIIGAILLVLYPADEYFNLNGNAVLAVACGLISLVLGIPLLFIKVNFFWFDIVYIVGGLWMVNYVVSLPDGAYIGEGLFVFFGIACVMSGGSYLVRRLLAFILTRRKNQAAARGL